MPEWWTYSLSDMLLFSPRVYYRLLELHNHALWPAHLLTIAAGLGMAYALARPRATRARLTYVVLGVLWIWVAWAFFWQRYATINWASPYVAPAFTLQGLMLIAAGLSRKRLGFISSGLVRSLGALLLAAALIGYPLIPPIVERSWSAAEVFGIAPDPTALATLAILAVARNGARPVLMIIPLLWIIISTATLWTMQSPEFWIAPLAALVALGIAFLPARPRPPAA